MYIRLCVLTCSKFNKYNIFLDPKGRNSDGYLSEPEKGYDSDFGENRLFQRIDGDHSKHVFSTRRS